MAVAALSSLVTKGAEELGKTVFNDAYTAIKERLSKKPESKSAVEKFEQNPSEGAPALRSELGNHLAGDAELALLLAVALEKFGAAAPGSLVGKIEAQQVIVAGTMVTGEQQRPRPIPRMAPPPPAVFEGRDEALSELVAALKLGQDATAAEVRPLALRGQGGVGKTTLAAALAHHPDVEAALPDGTLWAGLGPEPNVMTELAAWGAQFGEDFSNYDSPETRSRALSTLLDGKSALLVVDDIWQADAARYFLVGGRGCRTLITTRDDSVARALAGRTGLPVTPLTKEASLNLLQEIATDAVNADEKGARGLAAELGGLPLALTLAGRMIADEWEAGIGVAGALGELKEREARLGLRGAEKRPGLPTAEQSLRAVLGISYDRLADDATRRAFRFLGAFGSSPLTFSLEGATAVWGMEDRTARKTLVALVSRALVEPMEGGRYSLHTTLADFAECLLEEQDEAKAARDAQANYYLEFARENVGENWRAVEVEMGQIRRGFGFLLSRKDPGRVVAYVQTMSRFMERRGLWDEWRGWAEHSREIQEQAGDRAGLGVTLNNIGFIYYRKGAWDEALGYYERSREIFEELGDRAALAMTLTNIGVIYRRKGSWDEALGYYERSREIQEEIGGRAGLALTLNNIGVIHKNKGEWDEALGYYQRSREICEEVGDRAQLAVTLNNIGLIYDKKGAWDEALEYYQHSREICEEIGDRAQLAVTLLQHGNSPREGRQFPRGGGNAGARGGD